MDLSSNWRHLLMRVDRMTQRERWLVLGAALSLLAGLELLVVMPMNKQRLALTEMAVTAAQEAERQDIASAQALKQQEEALAQRLKAANEALRALGVNADWVGTRGQSLSFLLSKTLQGSPVQVVSLSALDAQAMSLPRAANEGNEANEAPAPQTLFRHRYVLKLHGEVDKVMQALTQMQDALKPLRLERLKLEGRPDGSVLTTIHWATIGLEKSWLSL